MNELLKKMKEVNEQIVGLEAKRADADEAEANVPEADRREEG